MANGTPAVRYEDISDVEQVPEADLTVYPETLYFAIAQIFPSLKWYRASLPELIQFLNTALPLHAQVLEGETQRAAIDASLQGEITKGVGRDGRIGTNEDNIASLLLRVGALERGTTHSGSSDVTGTFTIGMRDVNGDVRSGSTDTITYHGLPSSVRVPFPEAEADDDRWYFTLPSGVGVQHIFNEAIGEHRNDTANWAQESGDDGSITYVSLPRSRGLGGDYTLALTVRQEAQDDG